MQKKIPLEPSVTALEFMVFFLTYHFLVTQVIRRSQTDSARPPAGKLTLQVQVPRFLDDPGVQQTRQQRGAHGEGRAESLHDDTTGRGSFEGASQPLPLLAAAAVKAQQLQQQQQQAGDVSITARFVVTYSGPGDLRDATLNICPPPGFSAEPSSALLPPIRGTGYGGGVGGSGGGGGCSENEPQVTAVVLKAERGTGRLPSTLVGHASVVYTRQGTSGDGRSEPMSARCDLRVPLAMAGRVVEPSTKKGGHVHKFTFATTRPPVRLSSLFEDMAMMTPHTVAAGIGGSSSRSSSVTRAPLSFEDAKTDGAGGAPAGYGDGGGGGAPVSSISDESTAFSLRYWAARPDAEGGAQDVSVAVSKNSGRYRVQSESLPALCVVAAEVVRRLREHFGEPGAGRDRGSGECPGVDKGEINPDEGEMIGGCLPSMHKP